MENSNGEETESPDCRDQTGSEGKAGRQGFKETTLKFCPHNELLSHLSKGWTLSDELHGTSHGHWSVLLEWKG